MNSVENMVLIKEAMPDVWDKVDANTNDIKSMAVTMHPRYT
jgi:TFIIF-interacting CTD phosphatase-like protein